MSTPDPTPQTVPATRAERIARFMERWMIHGYFGLVLFSVLIGYRYYIHYPLYQILPVELLKTRLGESLFYLHSQPPMLNLLLGSAIKLEMLTGLSPNHSLLALHILLGWLAMLGLRAVARPFLNEPRRVAAFLILILFSPTFYFNLFSYFYTFHEFTIFALLSIAVWRYLESPGLRRYAAVCGLCFILAYTRSLFHFVFILGTLGLLALDGVRRVRASAGFGGAARLAGLFVLASAAILAWPMKNKILFNTFSFSSWQGYNISQGIYRDPLKGLDLTIPERFKKIPALTMEMKDDIEYNWNRYSVLVESKELGRITVRKMIEEPKLVFNKAGRNYWNMTRFAGRHPYYGGFGDLATVPPVGIMWMSVYEFFVFLDPRTYQGLASWDVYRAAPMPWHLSGFALLLPVILYRVIRRILAERRRDPLRAKMAAFMFCCVTWVMLMGTLVDGLESNRMRYSTEPYLMMLALWAFGGGGSPVPTKPEEKEEATA